MNETSTWSLPQLLGEADARALLAAMNAGEAHLIRGEPGRFSGLFDEARLRAALLRIPQAAPTTAPRFGALTRDPLGDGLTHTEAIDLAMIDSALAAGLTICVTDISPFDEALDRALGSLRRSLACVGDLRFNAYLSPSGARTAMHTDVRISTSLQLAGRKRWRYQRRPAIPYPPANAQIDRFGEVVWMNPLGRAVAPLPPPDPRDIEELLLHPGDLLCVPAGAWHEVLTEERGLGLNLSIRLRLRDETESLP